MTNKSKLNFLKSIESRLRAENASHRHKMRAQLEAVEETPHRAKKELSEPLASINAAHFETARLIAQYSDLNSPIAIAVVDYLVNNIVGEKGVQVEPLPLNEEGEVDQKTARRLSMLWGLFLREADVRGHNFAQVQRFAARHWLVDGEVFVHKITGEKDEAGEARPLLLELVTSERVLNHTDEKAKIFAGVKLNQWGAAEAYTVATEPPGVPSSKIARAFRLISAQKLLHVCNRRSINNLRGYPITTPAAGTLQDAKDYEEAELIGAKMVASLVLAVTKEPPEDSGLMASLGQFDFEEETGEEAAQVVKNIEKEILELAAAENAQEMEVRPGMVAMHMKPGEAITPIERARGGTNYPIHRKESLKTVAAATGANYSTIARDYGGTYSAQRQELIETWQGIKVMQNEFASQFVEKVYRAFVFNCVENGLITPPADIFLLDNAQYSPPNMPWIDPLKEITAAAKSNEAGFTSKQETIRGMGRNPEDTFAQLEKEEARGLGRAKSIADVQHAAQELEAMEQEKEKEES